MPEEVDLFEALIDRIAEAVVDKIEQRRKIDLIAEAVLARLEERERAEGTAEPVGAVEPPPEPAGEAEAAPAKRPGKGGARRPRAKKAAESNP